MLKMWTLALLLALFVSTIVFAQESIFDFTLKDTFGNDVSLEKYRDAKAILIVNVASKCGYTYKNYRELVDLYDRLHSRGLEILAFPSGQFGDQEFKTNEEIREFVATFGATFPLFAKINVVGDTAHPLYEFLRYNTDGSSVNWNFNKYLVVDGVPISRYPSKVHPKKIEPELLEFLGSDEL